MKTPIELHELQSSWLHTASVHLTKTQWKMDDHPRHMFDLQTLVQQMGNVSYFKGMPESALRDIVDSGQILLYRAHSVIFREGESAAGMHVLLRGQVRLTKVGLQGIESIIYLLKSVVMFNEATVIDGKPNPVTAIADQDCVTWQISYDRYQLLMQHYPELGIGLLRIMADRNRVLLARYEDLMSRPVLARTAKLLISISQNGQKPINRNEHPNQRMAAMAATVPEAISRSIKTLRLNQVIECTRAQIKVLSIDELTKVAMIEPIILEYRSEA